MPMLRFRSTAAANQVRLGLQQRGKFEAGPRAQAFFPGISKHLSG